MPITAKKRPRASKPADRHKKPKLGFHLDEELLAALNQYLDATKPRPQITAVMVTALEEFLQSKGFWPPPA